jgi:DNA polymerase III epsilon subunit-like protein
MVKQTVNTIFDMMRANFEDFPNNYLSFDTETTGGRPHKGRTRHFDGDLITELGYCHVRDGVAIDYAGFVLNWFCVKDINRQALINRLRETKQHIEFDRDGYPTGKTCHMTAERMEEEGSDPLQVLEAFMDLLAEAKERKRFYVAHNGSFDMRMLKCHFEYWLGKPFTFAPNSLVDTGMIFKAGQTGLQPWIGDTLDEWANRVCSTMARGIKWSLDRDCTPTYRLVEKYDLDPSEAHNAAFDSYVAHLLFEEYKKVASGEIEEPPLVSLNATKGTECREQ